MPGSTKHNWNFLFIRPTIDWSLLVVLPRTPRNLLTKLWEIASTTLHQTLDESWFWMKVESVYKSLHAFHCLIVSYLNQTEHERMSSQISKSNPKARRHSYCWPLFYIRNVCYEIFQLSVCDVVTAGRVGVVVRMLWDRGWHLRQLWPSLLPLSLLLINISRPALGWQKLLEVCSKEKSSIFYECKVIDLSNNNPALQPPR